ncbi:MAG: type II toxin-antitoxin system VapC family toxin [Bryobacteraceae bacterium]
MTVLVDSGILIELSRGRNEEIAAKWMNLGIREDLILCSPISVAELWAGARLSEHAALRDMFDALVCVPITSEIGRRAGEILNRYRKSHHVEIADAMIAATAIQSSALLWTRNRKHYPMKELAFFEE